jgi:hypothetical protein
MGKPSWAVRRRIIWTGIGAGLFMILAGTVAVFSDRMGSPDLITGGVALITLVLTSYIGGATYEDVRLHKQMGENQDG